MEPDSIGLLGVVAVLIVVAIFLLLFTGGWRVKRRVEKATVADFLADVAATTAPKPPTITKTYIESQARAMALFRADSKEMLAEGYIPTTQTVSPAGTLTVTYELQVQEKTCPRCAERVKAAALMCRYCGYEFSPSSTTGPAR